MLPSFRMSFIRLVLVLASSQLLDATITEQSRSRQQRGRPYPTSFGLHPHPYRLSSAVADSYLALTTLVQEFPPTVHRSFFSNSTTISSFQATVTDSLHKHFHPSSNLNWASDALPRGSSRRQLQLKVDVPAVTIPSLPANTTTNSTFIILAPNRTRRPNPLTNFQYYDGGWDFFSADYWASLAWSTVYGAAIGFVWLLFGLGIVVWAVMTCLCCHHKWAHLRDKSVRYERSELTLPLLFMLFGVLLELIGFALMVAGAVKFTNTAHSLTSFTVSEVQRVSSVVTNVTPILRQLADTKSILQYAVTPELRSKLLQIANNADNIAAEAEQKSEAAGNSVNHVLDVLQTILFCVGIITVGFVLIGLIFTCCRLVVLSNIMTTIVWFLCFVTWVLVTVFLFVWLFGGDTTVSLGEISIQPTDLSKFNLMVPCMDPTELESLVVFARFIGYQSIVIVNATIFQRAPFIFQLMRAPSGICNPFGPAPNFTFNPNACQGICSPYDQYCRGTTMTLRGLVERFSLLKCNSTNVQQCIVVNNVTSTVQEVSQAAEAIVDGVSDLLPLLEKLLRCAYISNLANSLQTQVGELEYDTFLLWMGFMFVSIGAIFFGSCAPIYVYRAVRCFGPHEGASEREPIKEAYSSELGEHEQSNSATQEGQGDYLNAEPKYENGSSWAARPAPPVAPQDY